MVLVVMAASIVPLILYSVHADYIGIAISACLCYIYCNDLVQQDVQAALKEERGRIVVSDIILRKPGRLTPEEFEEMKKHASAGKHFDPQLAKIFPDHREEFEKGGKAS